MCPLCIGTAALLLSSGTSAGGLAALVVRRRARKNKSIDASCGRPGDSAMLSKRHLNEIVMRLQNVNMSSRD